MRLRRPRGRTGLVLGALLAAMLVPAAVSAAGPGHGQLTPAVPAPSPSSAGRTGGQAPDIYLVQLASGADTFRQQAKAVGLNYSERFAYKSLFNGVSIRINPNDVGKLAGIASVSNVYPAHYYTLGPVTDADPELATAIQMTGADLAQQAGYTGKGVKVAVMDTGIDVDHPDLGGDGDAAARTRSRTRASSQAGTSSATTTTPIRRAPRYNPVPTPDPVPDDCNGHGTHVAGIVGANGHGRSHATGVAPDVTFGAYRVFGCDGSVTDDVMIAAMERIKADKMDVLNMSIGDAFNNWAGVANRRRCGRARRRWHRRRRVDRQQRCERHLLGRSARRRRQGHRRRVLRQQSRAGAGNHPVRGRLRIAIADSTAGPGFPQPPDRPTSGTFLIKQTAIGTLWADSAQLVPAGASRGAGSDDGCDVPGRILHRAGRTHPTRHLHVHRQGAQRAGRGCGGRCPLQQPVRWSHAAHPRRGQHPRRDHLAAGGSDPQRLFAAGRSASRGTTA